MWTIHDLMHRYEPGFPEVSAFGRGRHRDRHFERVCARARALLVDSEVGRRHVHEAYGFPVEAIFPLPYIAPRYMYGPHRSASPAPAYELPERFVFYPAQFWAHKNHLRLIEAVRRLRAELPDLKLVLAGSKKNGYAAVEHKVKSGGLEDVVQFLGFVPESDLPMLYRRAVALVLPTFFGPTNIPPLEAFVAGCPVAASRIYGMPEQLCDAALFFDPLSVDDIADAVRRLWTDDVLRGKLRARGRARIAAWGTPQFNQRFATIVDALVNGGSQACDARADAARTNFASERENPLGGTAYRRYELRGERGAAPSSAQP
jgi:glycosyltransferase involved in cell wall biosynthesis